MKRIIMAICLMLMSVLCFGSNNNVKINKEECCINKNGKTFPLHGKVYITNYKSEADLIIYITNYKSEADLLFYMTEWKSENNCGLFYLTQYKSEADVIIYYTNYKSEADLLIYKTDYKSEAGVK
jgi:hypothetical protein